MKAALIQILSYGRSIGKSRVVDHAKYSKKHSIRLNGEHAYQSINCSMNTEKFKNYIEKILCPTLKFGNIVVMDNLSVHKNKEIEKIIHRVYLPPYSPDLNPMEMMWSKMKSYLRK